MKKILFILSLIIAVSIQCDRKESAISRTVIIPDSLNLLQELLTRKNDIFIIPISYSCTNCIEILKKYQQLINNGDLSVNQIIIFLARGEPDEYFLHHVNNLKYKYYLIQDKYNDFLSLNDILYLNNGACIKIHDKKIKWIGYPFQKNKDLNYLLRRSKNEN